MTGFSRGTVAGIAVMALSLAASGPAGAARVGPADLIATLLPAVVNITVTKYETHAPVDGNMVSQPIASDRSDQSSGFFVAPSGLIVTNRHAIAGASEITVTLHDATRLRACVVAVAAQTDIAVLQVVPSQPVPSVVFGDSDALRPGDPVYLIGNPLGLSGSVTAGIVSARERDTEQSGFGSFFQLDASLNHGNSGGPVFNAAGEVVGVATALQSPGSETGSVGLGLAIPGLDAKFAAEQLVGHRALRLGWIGAHIQPVNADIAAAVGLPAATGSIITQVDMDGPATRAGLRLGDIILRLADDDGTIPRTLSRRIARAVAGDVIELSVWRDGAQQSVKVVIGASPAEVAEAPAATPACTGTHTDRPDLGLVLGPVTDDVSRKLALRPHETGALVTDVRDNSVAAERGMTVGSLIENVQGRPVASPDDVRAALESARQAHRTLALLLVRNAQGLRWTALPLAAAP